MNLNLFIAIMFGIAGFSMGVRHIITSPQHMKFDTVPEFQRVGLFALSVMMAGGSILFWGYRDAVNLYAGDASMPLATFITVLAVYNVLMLLQAVSLRPQPHKARLYRFPTFAQSPPENTREAMRRAARHRS